MAHVSLKNIRKVYENGYVAVENASIEIKDGEFLVLVGPSGCGKSTTLRMLAGLESITEGDIEIGDIRVNDLSPKDRDIAMVFQNYALYPHMTVAENMGFGLKLRKYPKDEIVKRVNNAAEVLGLQAELERKPGQLSGGQRQRVAVGRAIVRKPKVFLFDEPLSNLDAKLRVQMRAEISKLHHNLGATMVYVTHDQVEAMTMADRIVVMKDGHVQQVDAPLNLYNYPTNKFVASFIGSPSMNFIEGVINKEGTLKFISKNDGITINIPASVQDKLSLEQTNSIQQVTLGIRPEDISLSTTKTPPKNASTLTLSADVIEPMGHEIVLYGHAGGQQLVARLEPQETPTVGKTIQCLIDTDKLHFFDTESEISLCKASHLAEL